MDYPSCHLRCNGLLNCQQLDNLLMELTRTPGRDDVVNIYSAMLKRNFKNCPLNGCYYDLKSAVSMY